MQIYLCFRSQMHFDISPSIVGQRLAFTAYKKKRRKKNWLNLTNDIKIQGKNTIAIRTCRIIYKKPNLDQRVNEAVLAITKQNYKKKIINRIYYAVRSIIIASKYRRCRGIKWKLWFSPNLRCTWSEVSAVYTLWSGLVTFRICDYKANLGTPNL